MAIKQVCCHCSHLSLSLAVAEDSLASAKLELRSALRSAFAIFDCIEDWLRRSPYASTVLEQVRDGIRLKRGFGCGSAMAIKQVCCHCSHLSLSLAVAEDSLASAKLELRSALRSAFAIFDGCRRLASPRLLRLKRPRTSLKRYPAKLGFGGRPAFGSVGGPGCVAFRHEGKGRNLFWSCASFAGFRKGREWLLEGAFTAGFMNPRRKVPWNLLYDLKGGVFNG